MKGKYKKIYLLSFTLLCLISVASIFFVFNKYRSESKNSLMVSGAKFKSSKLKEKISDLESKLLNQDSTLLKEIQSIRMDQVSVDSLLNFTTISDESLAAIAEKIANLANKSGEVEKSIGALAVEDKTDTQK